MLSAQAPVSCVVGKFFDDKDTNEGLSPGYRSSDKRAARAVIERKQMAKVRDKERY